MAAVAALTTAVAAAAAAAPPAIAAAAKAEGRLEAVRRMRAINFYKGEYPHFKRGALAAASVPAAALRP